MNQVSQNTQEIQIKNLIINQNLVNCQSQSEFYFEDSLTAYAEGGGAEDLEAADDDVENIDFNNYKGIYADDEGGEKYTCPETGAHFEPKDLCKRIYKIIEKRKPFEQELYGASMLLDGVGSSLIAEAPYASSLLLKENGQTENNLKKKGASSSSQNQQKTGSSSHGGSQVRQNANQNYQVPNARAGSMKTQQQTQQINQSQVIIGENGRLMTQQELQMKNNAINEAYEAKQSTNQNQKYFQNQNGSQSEAVNIKDSQINQQNFNGSLGFNQQQKVIQKPNISNEEHCLSSSLLSEKLDNRNMANFTSGNLQRVKFKNKFGEIQNQEQELQQNNGSQSNQQKSLNSKSPQKNNRLQTQPTDLNQQMKLQQSNNRGEIGGESVVQRTNQSQLSQQQNQLKLIGGQMAVAQQQNSRNLIGGTTNPVNQSHSMHSMIQNNKNLQKSYVNGQQIQSGQTQNNQKSLSIGGNAFTAGQQNQMSLGLQTLNQLQGQSRQQQQTAKGIPSRMSTAGGGIQNGNKQMQTLNQQQNSKRAQSQGQNLTHSQTRYQQNKANDRLSSQLGQNQQNENIQKHIPSQQTQAAQKQKIDNNESTLEDAQNKPKDAYTLIQEQQRAEQAKQPQNQFEHQENILKQLNSDEVYEKLMKIQKERDQLYIQMDQENNQKNGSNIRESSIGSQNQLVSTLKQPQKNQSAEPVIRGHQINPLNNGPQLAVSTINANLNINHPYQQSVLEGQIQIPLQNQAMINGFQQQQLQDQSQSQLQIPLKQQNNNFVAGQNIQQSQQLKFQQYVINNQQQNQLHNIHQQQNQIQNSRNQVLKNGLGGRLNTKNTNLSMNTGGSIGGRVNTHQSFSGVGLTNLKQNLNKSIQLNNNQTAANNQNSGAALATSSSQIASISQTVARKDQGVIKSGTASGMNNYQVSSNQNQHTLTGSSKITKKKAQNLSSNSHSNPNNFNINYNQNMAQTKILGIQQNTENTQPGQSKTHQSQISLNIANDGIHSQNFGTGINQMKNSFYGGINNNQQPIAGTLTNNSYTVGNQSGRKQSNNIQRQSINQNKIQINDGMNQNNFINNQGNTANEETNQNVLKVSQTNNIQQPTKNDIIAKYMKAVSNNGNINPIGQQITQQQLTTTQPSLANNKGRQSSGVNSNHFTNFNQNQPSSNNNGLISQYNNFMKSMANHQNLKNPILSQNNNVQGSHSRNYQNNLGVSSKTHTESMIYNNNSSINIGGSFNHGMSTNNNQASGQAVGRNAQNKTMHGGMTGSHSSITGTANPVVTNTIQAGNRPASSYSGKAIASKKKNNMSDPQQHLAYQQQQQLQSSQSTGERSYGQQVKQKIGNIQQNNGFQNTFGQQNHHIINQSLKPKMIMNNLNQANKSISGGDVQGQSQHILINNQNENVNTGDIQVSNISITNTGRPQSSKLMKKKPTGPSQQSQTTGQYQNNEKQSIQGTNQYLKNDYQGQQYNQQYSHSGKTNSNAISGQFNNYQNPSQNIAYSLQQKTQQLNQNQIQYSANNPQQQSIHIATLQSINSKQKQQQYFGANPSQ